MPNQFLGFLDELSQSSMFDAECQHQPMHDGRQPFSHRHGAETDQSSVATRQADSGTRPHSLAPKRSKYIQRACQNCQRRKIKCSGGETCSNCRARGVICIHVSKPEAGRRPKRSRQSDANFTSQHRMGTGTRGSNGHPGLDGEVTNIQPLQAEIHQLREEVKRLSQSADWSRTESSQVEFLDANTLSSGSLSTADETAEDVGMCYAFNNGTGYDNLSLSAQLSDLQIPMRSTGSLASIPQPYRSGRDRTFPLKLPPPRRLRYLLGVYFREMDSFFPFLDQPDTEARLNKSLEILDYSQHNLTVNVDRNRTPLLGLLCNMLVLGEGLDPDITAHNNLKPGWETYHRGNEMVRLYSSSASVDIDLIRYYTLAAPYMMNCGLLHSASQAIATAVHLAMVAGLNDQASWGECTQKTRTARKRLWWCIYYLDRLIALRNRTPFIIRDIDVAVDQFGTNDSDGQPLESGRVAVSLPDQRSQEYSCATYTNNYVQSLINFAKLWEHIWNTFYAISGPKSSDWVEVALTESRILIYQRKLPPHLTWDTLKIHDYVKRAETEHMILRRLVIYIRLNLLRMNLLQNPVLSTAGDGDDKARKLCADIAHHSVAAMEAYARACPKVRSSGHFVSTALSECLYHFLHALQGQRQRRQRQVDRSAVVCDLRRACRMLSDFASTWVAARRTVQCLSSSPLATSASWFEGKDNDAAPLLNALLRLNKNSVEDDPAMEDTWASAEGGGPEYGAGCDIVLPARDPLDDFMKLRTVGAYTTSAETDLVPWETQISNQILQQNSCYPGNKSGIGSNTVAEQQTYNVPTSTQNMFFDGCDTNEMLLQF